MIRLWLIVTSYSPPGYRSDVLIKAPVNKRSLIRSIAVSDILSAHQIGSRGGMMITRSPTSRAKAMTDHEADADEGQMVNRIAVKHVRPVSLCVIEVSDSTRVPV